MLDDDRARRDPALHLTEAELAQRRPVWSALSDLFLDTETRWYFPRVALTLVESGLPAETLERIWRYEVYPECWRNLLSVAGEWAALTLDEERLIDRAERAPGVHDRLLYWAQAGGLERQWRQLVLLTSTLRTLEPRARLRRAGAWTCFAHAYLEEEMGDVMFLEEKVAALRAIAFPRSELERTFEMDFRPVYRALLIGGERGQESRRAENVLALIERACV